VVFTAVTDMEEPSFVAPVEYAVAVDRFLAAAGLSAASQRVYRIALTTWAWMLVERESPVGASRRGATAPVVPLGLLDSASAPARLVAGFAAREAAVGARTANRELAILRSALSWWRARGWVASDPTAGMRRVALAGGASTEVGDAAGKASLSEEQVRAVLRLRAPLREQALWHAVYDSGGGIERILHAEQSATESGDPDLIAAIAQQPPCAGWQPNLAFVLRRRVRGQLAHDVACVGHPDRAVGVFGEALHVGGGCVHQL